MGNQVGRVSNHIHYHESSVREGLRMLGITIN